MALTDNTDNRDYLATAPNGKTRRYTISAHVIAEGRLPWALDEIRRWACYDLECGHVDPSTVKLERIWSKSDLFHNY